MIEVLRSGAANSIQDLGRPGLLHLGISAGGAMDAPALHLGNLLLGNSPEAAGLEIVLYPFHLKFHVDCQFALTGADCEATLDQRPVYPSWLCNAKAGQVLVLRSVQRGARSYLSFEGGIEVEPMLGARSTDLKTGFGGLQGRGLQRGDRLQFSRACGQPVKEVGAAFHRHLSERGAVVKVQVLPGAEWEAFGEAARQAFLQQCWTITPDSNRMGMRLKGEELTMLRPLEMLSHGILPGTVQVPPSGQPIIQLVDANTCGGYPKIAHVIDADLWKLGQAPISAKVRFVLVDIFAAQLAQDEIDQELAAIERALQLRRRFA